jgi:hypothetical protein
MTKVLFPVLVLGLTSSVAMAEPVQLSSLQLDGVTAGSEGYDRKGHDYKNHKPKDKDVTALFDEEFELDIDVDKHKEIAILKWIDVYAKGEVWGNIADAEALSEALGEDTLAETLVFTFTNYDLSTSYAEALSVTDDNKYKQHRPKH